MKKLSILLLIIPLLISCSSGSMRSESPAGANAPPADLPYDMDTPALSPLAQLLNEAEQLRRAGELDLSSSRLERALRVWPQEPMVWYQLAVVRSNQLQWKQSENLARKSIAKGTGNRDLTMKNWWLIALVRQKLGDAQGANNAKQRALDLIDVQ